MAKETENSSSVDTRTTTGQSGAVREKVTQRTDYRPGSALIYKGEPTASELNMLRFGLKPEDTRRVNSIVTDIMTRYEDLEQLGEKAVLAHVNAVVKRITQDKRAVPFKLDYSAPEDRRSAETKAEHATERDSKLMRLLRRLDPR